MEGVSTEILACRALSTDPPSLLLILLSCILANALAVSLV